MLFQIKSWLSAKVLFEIEADCFRDALEKSVKQGAHLRRAHLRRADLTGAHLTGAHLRRADLTGADLTGADLRDADLTGANLTGADLTGADLTGADLTGADLRDADLTGAHLTGADLRGAHLRDAHLRDAHLRDAHLTPIRDDLWAVLSAAPAEVAGLLAALKEGRVDGSVYCGDCACLVGTLAKVRGCAYDAIAGLTPDSRRPAERWFLNIHPGNTPETSDVVQLTEEWVETWLANMRHAFGAPVA